MNRMTLKARLTAIIAVLAILPAVSVATATSASAAWRASDPVIKFGQRCLASYEKGIVVQSGFALAPGGDRWDRCVYQKWQGPVYMGTHTVWKR